MYDPIYYCYVVLLSVSEMFGRVVAERQVQQQQIPSQRLHRARRPQQIDQGRLGRRYERRRFRPSLKVSLI
jgi:hypothetical protein